MTDNLHEPLNKVGITEADRRAARERLAHEDETDCGHHSWDGLMALLDEHWPEDVFPTRTDHPDRDPGPRIVSLIRMVDRLQARIGMLKVLEAALRQGPPEPPR